MLVIYVTQIQLWRHPDELDRHVDIWISPKSLEEFNKLSGALNLTYEMLTKNIYDEWGNKKYSMNNIENFDLVYQRYEEVINICCQVTLPFPVYS